MNLDREQVLRLIMANVALGDVQMALKDLGRRNGSMAHHLRKFAIDEQQPGRKQLYLGLSKWCREIQKHIRTIRETVAIAEDGLLVPEVAAHVRQEVAK